MPIKARNNYNEEVAHLKYLKLQSVLFPINFDLSASYWKSDWIAFPFVPASLWIGECPTQVSLSQIDQIVGQ